MRKCLECGRGFVPRHPSQKFCPKRKTGRHLCKDRYHNRERVRAGDITASRAAYLGMRATRVICDEIPTVNGVDARPDYVGITDQEHEDIMNGIRDDY